MKRRSTLVTLLTLSLLAPLGALAQTGFSNLYVFGDSLSDNGNLATLPDYQFLQNAPFDNGFCNGERAVEILGERLALPVEPSFTGGTNYSVAGARASGLLPIDLSAQVAGFLVSHGGSAPSDALYLVFIGGNDIRDARDAVKESVANRLIKDATKAIDANLRALIDKGARSIMVVNSPDLGAIPESLVSRKLAQRATKMTNQFNSQLATKISRIEQDTGIDLVTFDLFTFFQTVMNSNQALGFTDKTDACYDSLGLDYLGDCSFDKFDEYVFFDAIHPTARVQERTGRAFYSVVPEPVQQPD